MLARLADPRLYQIAVLSALLLYGVGKLDFEIGFAQAAVTLLTVLGTQWLCTVLMGAGKFEPKSALISGLSLCLLLRTNVLWLAAAGALMAITSKFLLRWRGKHLFNPTNFALVGLLLCADGCAWVSPAQWGNVAFFAFALACLGGLVLTRAGRADVALSFLAFYLGLVFARSIYLGEPLAIPLPPAAKRRAPDLRFFHDFRSAHDARFARGADRLRSPRGVRRVVRAVPAFPHERLALEPRAFRRARAAARLAAARVALPLAPAALSRFVRSHPESHP